MYLDLKNIEESSGATIIGRLYKIESPFAILKSQQGNIYIKYVNLHTYPQDIVMVYGNVEYDRDKQRYYIVEQNIFILSNFDEKLFEEIRKKMLAMQEIF